MGNVFLCKINFVRFFVLLFLLLGGSFYCYLATLENKVINDELDEASNLEKISIAQKTLKPVIAPNIRVVKKESPKYILSRANLYLEDTSLSFFTIKEISTMPYDLKKIVEGVMENYKVYFLNYREGKIFAIVSNTGDEKYIRHDIKFLEINEDGVLKEQPFNICLDTEGRLNTWNFDKITNLPLKHIKYSKKGVVEYIEEWNYSDSEPVKYMLKNAEGNLVSLKKESTSQDGLGIISEYVNYDVDGNIQNSVSINYDGPQLTRFTYFDANNKDDSVTLVSKYLEGLKITEEVYSYTYKLDKTYSADYFEGELASINVFNSMGIQTEKILSE